MEFLISDIDKTGPFLQYLRDVLAVFAQGHVSLATIGKELLILH